MTPEGGRLRGRILCFLTSAFALAGCWFLPTLLAELQARVPSDASLGDFASWPQPALVFGAAPLCVLAAALAWWLPGALWAALVFRPTRLGRWILQGFVTAFFLNSALLAVAKLAGGFGLDARAHLLATALSHLLAFLAVATSKRRVLASIEDWGGLWVYLLLPIALTIVLFPELFWTNLSDDGQEALFMGQSLTRAFVPSWPTQSGQVGLGVGMFASAWMNEWWVGCFGTFDAVPRLPFLLLLPIVLAGVVETVRAADGRLRPANLFALGCGVGLVGFVLGTSAGYSPYFCEIASPGAFDLLLLAALLAVLAAILDGRHLAAVPALLIATLARPTPLLILGLGFGVSVLIRRGERRRWLVGCSLGILLCLGLAWAHQKFYLPAFSKGDSGYGASSVLGRFRYLWLFPWQRFAFAIVPCGIVPWLSFLFWKRLDAEARRILLVSLAYLLAFVFPAFVSLHHFAPAMVLPLVVWGRLSEACGNAGRRGLAALLVLGVVLSAWLSLPPSRHAAQCYRRIGARMSYELDAERLLENPRATAEVLAPLAREERPEVNPEELFVGPPWSVLPYARAGEPDDSTLWRVVPAGRRDLGNEWKRLHEKWGVALWVRRGSDDETKALLAPPPTDFAAPLYHLRRVELHRHLGIPAKAYDVDLRELLGR